MCTGVNAPGYAQPATLSCPHLDRNAPNHGSPSANLTPVTANARHAQRDACNLLRSKQIHRRALRGSLHDSNPQPILRCCRTYPTIGTDSVSYRCELDGLGSGRLLPTSYIDRASHRHCRRKTVLSVRFPRHTPIQLRSAAGTPCRLHSRAIPRSVWHPAM
jgi:hypothetical protein